MTRILTGPRMSIVLTLVIAACTARLGSDPSPSPPSFDVTPAPTAAPVSASATAIEPVAPGPPVAVLSAEGGDPVEAQLGTYAWGDGGSDSPWLPGARIAVGSGEPLSLTLSPAASIAMWRARSVPASADGPAGATTIGQGTGLPKFAAPEAGTWTVEVHVVFGDGLGNASYFWRLAVD